MALWVLVSFSSDCSYAIYNVIYNGTEFYNLAYVFVLTDRQMDSVSSTYIYINILTYVSQYLAKYWIRTTSYLISGPQVI